MHEDIEEFIVEYSLCQEVLEAELKPPFSSFSAELVPLELCLSKHKNLFGNFSTPSEYYWFHC